MQRSRALAGLCNPGRCYSQQTRCLSMKSAFASFIADVKMPESVATSESTQETRRDVPRLNSLGNIEIPSSIPSKSPLFAARAAQRQKRPQAEATVKVKGTENHVTNTLEKTPTSSLRSVMSRNSQRLHTKDEERRSGGGALRPQTDANTRSRRPFNAGTSSSQADYRRRDGSRVARPSRVVEETSPGVDLGTTPSELQVSFNETDLSRLFSIKQRRSVAESDIGTRIQLLKEHAGDYSRYLPGETDPTSLTVGSVEYAKFILARKRDVELEERHIAVGLMQEAGLNSTSASITSSR